MRLVTATNAISEIGTILNAAATEKTLLLLSGGSSAHIAVAALQTIESFRRQNVTSMLADERYVPYGSNSSNATLLRSLGIEHYCREFIDVVAATDTSVDDTAKRFEDNLSRQLQHSTHIIAVFGIGADNHIAGILPSSIAAESREPLAVHYTGPDFERITITPAVFSRIRAGFAYAEGPEKENAVLAIEQNFDAITHPAQLIKQCVSWQILYNKEKV